MINRYNVMSDNTCMGGTKYAQSSDGYWCKYKDVLRLKQELQALKDKYRWRSVKDGEYPEQYQYVSCLNNSGQALCAYWDGKRGFFIDHKDSYRDVFLWMPLPEKESRK